MASGDVVWIGREQLGDRDGRIALYLADALPQPAAAPTPPPELSEHAQRVAGVLARDGRIVLRSAPPGRGRRLPRRHAGRALGTRVGGHRHQRHVAPLAQSALREGRRTRTPRAARRTARLARIPAPLPRPHRRQPRRRRPLVAGRAAHGDPRQPHRVERQYRPAGAGAQRHRDARNRHRGEHPGRLPGPLPRAQDHGGERLDSPRHVRRRAGRRPVRHDRRRRYAAQPAHRTRTSRSPAPGGIRSRQSLRRPAAVAGRRTARHGARRRRQRRPGQRTTRRLPAPPQSFHPRHPAGERARSHTLRARARAHAGRSRRPPADPAHRTADRRNQRRAGSRTLPRALPRRGRLRAIAARPADAPTSRSPPDMPEGDTIFRTARTLHRALAGQTVTALRNRPAQTRARRLRHPARRPHGRVAWKPAASGCSCIFPAI